MNTATSADFEALFDELKQLRADLAKVAKVTESLVKHAGGEATDFATEAGEQAWKKAKGSFEDVTKQIEERPLGSAAIALGVGVLLGLIVSGRRG